MDSIKALAILAFCAAAHAAALPQLPGLNLGAGTTTTAAAGSATSPAAADIAVPKPALPVVGSPPLPAVPALPGVVPNLPGVGDGGPPVPGLPKLPAGGDLPLPGGGLPLPGGLPVPPLPIPGTPAVPKLPAGDLPLPLPAGGSAPKPPVVGELPIPLPVPIPGLPLPDLPLPDLPTADPTDPASADALSKVVSLGTIVLQVILNILSKGAQLLPLPGTELMHSLPVGAAPDGSLPINKRQVTAPKPTPAAGGLTGSVSSPLGAVTGLTSNLSPVGGLTPNLPIVGGSSDPLSAVTGLTSNPPVVGGLTSNLPVVGGGGVGTNAAGGSPLGAVGGLTAPLSGVVGTAANAVGSLPVVGSAAAPVLNTVGGVTGGASPLNAVSGLAGTVAGAANSVPVAGPIVGGLVNGGASASSNANALPFQGLPNSDPVGAFSISVIATLLSLLKKDPLSLFAPSLPIPALVKRDLPELHKRGIPELMKRQLTLPSLSQGISGVGVGSLPLSGIAGVPPDLAFLVGSIAKNIAVPGGTGLGSITNNILGVLNGVAPNFLFKLPVVQDSVPTFGVLQLLSSINPAKFGSISSLTSLASLQQAASGIPASDLAFIKGLPVSPDPSNLITTIMNLADNLLTLPGNVANLKAAVSVLCLKNLGLAVPGL